MNVTDRRQRDGRTMTYSVRLLKKLNNLTAYFNAVFAQK